ncbi:MAG TPA: PEP-CTERM sorting domain-containing protein [Candidatus Cybelea sp.]|nr:PEP-CTERM sorting domain-containing protein [Candidatus Cybelea sp.]
MRLPTRWKLASSVAGIIALGWIGVVTRPAEATVIQINSRATFDALGAIVPVDWGAFGPTGTSISTPDSRTIGGITVGVASSQGVLARLDEGSGFTGTFAVGDHLLADAGSKSDTFIVSFGSPVRGFGTQIDAHYISGAFTGFVEVFTASNVKIFTANFSGNGTTAEDNSAPFVGVESSAADISFAEFFVNQTLPLLPAGALAINRLDVLVPEPATLAVFAPALMGIMWLRRRRRRDQQ